MKASFALCGAGRGGTVHSNLTIQKLAATGQRHLLSVEVHDPQAGRAEEAALLYRREGIPATAHQADAPLTSDSTIEVLAMDHAPAFNRVIAKPITNKVLEVGLLTATPTFEYFGGSVIGLGATLTPTATDIHHNTGVIFSQFAGLAPERRTSRNISEPSLNTIKVADTRYQLHDRLTTSSMNYLNNGEVEPELFAIDGLTRNTYPLDVVEVRRNMLRAELVEVATQEIIPQIESANGHGGVAFFDQRELWLYFVLCHKIGARWSVQHAIEFPAMALAPVIMPRVVDAPRHRSKTTFLETLVTD